MSNRRSRILVGAALGIFTVTALICLSQRERLSGSNNPAAGSPQAIATSGEVIPFELEANGHIFLQMRVNAAVGWFILDTAGAGVVVSADFAREAGLKVEGGYVVRGGGPAQVSAGAAKDVTLGLGGLRFKQSRVVVTPLNSLESLLGRPLDGLLSSALFTRYVVETDYIRKQIRLYEPESYRGKGEALPLRLDEDEQPFVRLTLTAPGERPLEGEFLIDSAANYAAALQKSFADEHGISTAVIKTLDETAHSVGGKISFRVGRLESLQIGRWAFDAPLIHFSQATAGGMGARNRAGLIGGELLRRFTVVYDYRNRRLFLEPNASFHEPFDYDMSGLRLRADGPLFRPVRVERVLPDSPAAEAGLAAGDVIETVDGRPAAEFELDQLRERFRKPGAYRLGVSRRGKKREALLKLRRLI